MKLLFKNRPDFLVGDVAVHAVAKAQPIREVVVAGNASFLFVVGMREGHWQDLLRRKPVGAFRRALCRNWRTESGDKDGATDELLHIIRHARTWNDEAARKQLLQFFDAWGPGEEATRNGRRKLSSLLFA